MNLPSLTSIQAFIISNWLIVGGTILLCLVAWVFLSGRKPKITPTVDTPDDTSTDEELRVKERRWLFYTLCLLCLGTALSPLAFIDPTVLEVERWWLYILGVTGLFWALSSVQSIPIGWQAATDFFGIPLVNLGSGPKFLPKGFVRPEPFTKAVLQKQEPGEPENIFKGDDSEALPPGKVRPIRILTGAPATGASGILAIQMATEVTFYYRYRILDPLTFLVNVKDTPQFEKQIRDTAERILTEKVSQTAGVEALISNISSIRGNLETEIKDKVRGWGVEVIEVGLPAPDISKILAKALLKVGEDRATAGGVRALAEAARYKLVQEGAGAAEAQKALIDAINEALKGANPATVAAIVGEKVLGDKTTILGAQGLADAMGLLQILTEKLKKG